MSKINLHTIINSIKRAIETERLSGVEDIMIGARREAIGNRRGTKDEIVGANPCIRPIMLDQIKAEVTRCHKCSLSKTRTNVVFGEGNPHAKLMFIGEAPGADEDEQGRPFVGRAGQLLTKIIESIGLKREDVYIANILKCRPPGNRPPEPGEIKVCSPYLIKQIEAIKPKVICALGKFSAQTLLETETPISQLRGKFHNYHGIRLMPTYHPAYLLRNPAAKKEVWDDMKKIAKELEIPVSKKI